MITYFQFIVSYFAVEVFIMQNTMVWGGGQEQEQECSPNYITITNMAPQETIKDEGTGEKMKWGKRKRRKLYQNAKRPLKSHLLGV